MAPETSTEIRFGKPDKGEIAVAFLIDRVQQYGYTQEEANNLFTDSATLSPEGAYHNRLHPRESLWVGLQLIDEFIANGKNIDAKALIAAIMLHDCEDQDDPMFGKYQSPEHQAAAILVKNRDRYGLTTEQADRGKNNILATAIDAEITNDEEYIMVVSDVSNVGSKDKSFFSAKSSLLRVELYAKGIAKTATQFDVLSADVLSKIWLKVAASYPNSDWLRYAGSNISNFIEEAASRTVTDPLHKEKLLGNRAVKEFMRSVRVRTDAK